MEKRLADESIARELRQEFPARREGSAAVDVFSKDFGKTRSRSRKTSESPKPGRDVTRRRFVASSRLSFVWTPPRRCSASWIADSRRGVRS